MGLSDVSHQGAISVVCPLRLDSVAGSPLLARIEVLAVGALPARTRIVLTVSDSGDYRFGHVEETYMVVGRPHSVILDQGWIPSLG